MTPWKTGGLSSPSIDAARARQGMVLFIPPGNRSDPTRMPEMYAPIARLLGEVGVPTLD